MEDMLLIAMVLLVISCAILLGLCMSNKKNQPQKDNYCEEKARIEFSKKIVIAVLGMWVLSGVVGLWQVLMGETDIIEILEYVETASLASIGVYGIKSGAENCTKFTINKEISDEIKVNKEKNHEEH